MAKLNIEISENYREHLDLLKQIIPNMDGSQITDDSKMVEVLIETFMGFIEVIFNLKTIISNIKFCKSDIEQFNPDAIIFIDYPGFNMRIAKWAKERGIKTHYYISPQIWAWKENRISAIKRDFDELYIILPFEKDF